jgi:hypothetical protein
MVPNGLIVVCVCLAFSMVGPKGRLILFSAKSWCRAGSKNLPTLSLHHGKFFSHLASKEMSITDTANPLQRLRCFACAVPYTFPVSRRGPPNSVVSEETHYSVHSTEEQLVVSPAYAGVGP